MNKDSEKEETCREKEVFLKENNQKDASFFHSRSPTGNYRTYQELLLKKICLKVLKSLQQNYL